MPKVLVIHGPNLNLLGEREPDTYGSESFESVNQRIREFAQSLDLDVEIVQSNIEGELVNAIQDARGKADAIVINPAAYTHYSVAIRDALTTLDIPKVEVHLSNIHAREQFRKSTVTGEVADGIISGFGGDSYLLGLQAAKWLIERGKRS